jgi:alkanesulfonate monooxygenase SsuD/methylene tetrahydromethanopterin reductase-like flavin-dependent oxidoreductase (luciferase family)
VELLGSSAQSAVWAAELGLPYVFADFINPAGAAFAAWYRDHFQPSATLQAPRVSVAVSAIAAGTAEEALRLSASARMMFLLLFRGRLVPVPPVESALAFLAAEALPIQQLPEGRRLITGTPEEVRAGIEDAAAAYEAEEVFVVNIVHSHAARVRSYQLIAREFGK